MLPAVPLAAAEAAEPADTKDKKPVAIVISPQATLVEKTAASELAELLQAAYGDKRFAVVTDLPAGGDAIVLGTRQSMPVLKEKVTSGQLKSDGSFAAGRDRGDVRTLAWVCGQSPRAVLDGVYQVLSRRYNFGFAMSFQASEDVRPGPFSLAHWKLADAPLIPERLLFAWFNYLEVNGAWSLDDWRQALRNGARLGFNQLFFHCYANDPLLEFNHNGHTKRVGWRNSSRKGRTYAVEHVWDVRRLVGGELYRGPVFGSEAAVLPDGSDTVPDSRRVSTARELMVEVMAIAKAYGYHVIWGIDVDTRPATDPVFISKAVPASARFQCTTRRRWRRYQIVDPATEAGKDFFRSMLETYLNKMPGVDTYMIWVRNTHMSPVMDLAVKDLPQAWQEDLRRRVPAGTRLDSRMLAGTYYASRVAQTWREILDSQGRQDIGLGFGSWSWGLEEKFPQANALMAPEVSFLVVDYTNAFGRSSGFDAVMRTMSEKRVVGALMRNKNDDGGFFGKPMRPQQNIAKALAETGMQRLGTYSYMPRPCDLYTISVARQLWRNPEDADLASVIADAGRDWFGPEAAPAMSAYLQAWMKDSPLVGRTSGDHFMEELQAKWYRRHMEGIPKRIAMLEAVDRSVMSPAAQARWRYWRQLEEFMLGFHKAQWRFQQGDEDFLASKAAEQAIASLAKAFASHDVNPGEKGLIVDLHTRWLSFIVAERQARGLEPVRIRFLPTNHDPLARNPGKRTFAMDHQQRLWGVLGKKETNLSVVVGQPFAKETEAEVCGAWLASEDGIELSIGNVRNEARIGSGRYRVRLLAPGGEERSAQRVSLQGKERGSWPLPDSGAVAEFVIEGVTLSQGSLQLDIQAEDGPAVLSGVILEPLGPITPPRPEENE
jgi:hypothetical protein